MKNLYFMENNSSGSLRSHSGERIWTMSQNWSEKLSSISWSTLSPLSMHLTWFSSDSGCAMGEAVGFGGGNVEVEDVSAGQ